MHYFHFLDRRAGERASEAGVLATCACCERGAERAGLLPLPPSLPPSIALSLHFAVKSASINYAGVRSSDSSQQASGSPSVRPFRPSRVVLDVIATSHSPQPCKAATLYARKWITPKSGLRTLSSPNSLYPLMGVLGILGEHGFR